MRSRTVVVVAALAALPVAPGPAIARDPVGTILHAPYALLSGLSGHHRRHARRHQGRAPTAASHPATGPAITAHAPTVVAHAPAGQDAGRQPITLGAAGGWAGPVFWPNAADDVLNDVLWGSGGDDRFWTYGYADIAGAIVWRAGASGAAANTCGSTTASNEWPIEPIRQTIRPDAAQTAALEELRAGIAAAVERIASVCPGAPPRTATERLHAMFRRLRAARQAVDLLRAPVQKFYDALTDEQKARLEARARAKPADRRGCTTDIARVTGVATQALAQIVQPTDEQRMAFGILMGTSSKMAEMLMECPAQRPATPMARLDAAEKRLTAMLYATQIIRGAVHTFYLSLSDEQKARFDGFAESRQQATR